MTEKYSRAKNSLILPLYYIEKEKKKNLYENTISNWFVGMSCEKHNQVPHTINMHRFKYGIRDFAIRHSWKHRCTGLKNLWQEILYYGVSHKQNF